jgi:uncharacterized protein
MPTYVTIKILVAGPFSAGKTTLISSLSEVPVVLTEVATQHTSEATVKSHTTVAMDFGSLTLHADDDTVVRLVLFGTPGQERFRFMLDVLDEGVDATIIVVDGTSSERWLEASEMIAGLRRPHIPLIVVVNRRRWGQSIDDVRVSMGLLPEQQIFAANLVDLDEARETIATVLDVLLEMDETALLLEPSVCS